MEDPQDPTESSWGTSGGYP